MKSAHPLEREFRLHLRRAAWTAPGDRVLVSVSGGADSLALLHLFAAVRGPLSLTLEVVHFDHGLRAESGDEARWVAGRAGGWDLACHVIRHDSLARNPAGVQARAREWRRTESERLREARGARWIATGHQRDDHVETLLLKLLRGAHLSGLRGLEPRSGSWLRPLLAFGHGDLTAYLTDLGVTWLEDPSNRSPRYKRNRVRGELVPLLDDLAGGDVGRRLAPLERQSAQLAEWLANLPQPRQSAAPQSAAPQIGWDHEPHWIDAAGLLALPPLARGDCLHRFIVRRLPGQVAALPLERALELLERGRPAWDIHLSAGRLLRRRGERLLLLYAGRRDAAVSDDPTSDGAISGGDANSGAGGWRVEAPAGMTASLCPGPCPAGEGLALYNLPPGMRLEIRHRRPGDRFHPPWRERPVKVSDFLRDQRVPLWERERIPLAVADGRVVAIYPRWVAREHAQPGEEGRTGCLVIRGTG